MAPRGASFAEMFPPLDSSIKILRKIDRSAFPVSDRGKLYLVRELATLACAI
jgi:hypothetical protein